ncbi:MAG: class I SAM-dependent methyltransferase [Alphaproteobacteria bacterium]|nr:class I SAM-dependent methyltransferase [Alphaproteobacteria bacterium]
MPSIAALGAAYPPSYHAGSAAGLLQKLRDAARARPLVAALRERDGSLLDFGCGSGRFLQLLASRPASDHELVGYELADSVHVAREGPLTIVRGPPDSLDANLADDSVAVVTMNHVIEHLPDPAETLHVVLRKMRSGGLLFGQTPRAGGVEQRWFGVKWSGFHAPRHTVVFSETGLVRCLTRSGFVDTVARPAFNPAGYAVSLAARFGRLGQPIRRSGLAWYSYLAAAAPMAAFELLRPDGASIMNFSSMKP